jgi:uncharacterized Zn finger protein (UPF0148 family)
LQRSGRCPRCGYVLRFDGRDYSCDFCGYPRINNTVSRAFHEWGKDLKTKAHAMAERMKRPPSRQVFVYYPVAVQPCASCGVNLPVGTARCPNCGTLQETTTTSPPQEGSVQTESVEKRVLDYIIAHNGTISLSQAAQDLTLSAAVLQLTIDRLKTTGFLNQS